VNIQGQLSSIFKVKVGLRQGDAILFNTVLEKAIRNIEINPNGTIFNRTRQYLAYVDDVVILGRAVRATEEVLAQLKNTALKAGLAINECKTKYMRIMRM
jgi:pyrimidine operon attenuation protein/uracil phosphoribosyltransferase